MYIPELEKTLNILKNQLGHALAIETYGKVIKIVPISVQQSGSEILIYCIYEDLSYNFYHYGFEYTDYKNIEIVEIERKPFFDRIFEFINEEDFNIINTLG